MPLTSQPNRTPRILLLSAYDAISHQHWRKTLVAGFPQFDWVVLTLPARHFYWRVRSNALTFANQHYDVVNKSYDLVLATSMVDCSTLRGLIPSLAQTPLLVYCHENQFVYPLEKPSSNIVNAQLTSIMNVLCADRVLFNSEYNRRSFFAGAKALLDRMPDGLEGVDLGSRANCTEVLAVPTTQCPVATKSGNTPVEIIWNHRWEYDKQPDVFFAALRKLKNSGADFVVHVLGQSFRQVPECFALAKKEFAANIGTWGYQTRENYTAILTRADIVVSTALHDFQGLSVIEAIAAGCLPVVPDRVSYPEYVPQACRYRVSSPKVVENAVRCSQAIEEESTELSKTLLSVIDNPIDVPDVSHYGWQTLQSEYLRVMLETMGLGKIE